MTIRATFPARPTIRDVSRLAGVSRMTVSRVISDPSHAVPDTRARVMKAIAELGYVPDRAAGGLATRKTGFIALILPTLTNANFATFAHGLTDILRVAQYDLLIAYTDYDLAEEERQLRMLLARRPEAIVLAGATHRRSSAQLLRCAGVPIIEIADLAGTPIQHAVGFSNRKAGRIAARHLIAQGHRRIGAVASLSDGETGDFRGEARIRGFEEELRASNFSTNLVLRHGRAPVSFAHGAAAIGILLDREPRIEAVFAVSDLSAVGVVMECQRRAVDVPGRLSVVGFGDFDIGREINPPLATIHVDFQGMGQRAGRLLLALVEGKAEPEPTIIDVGVSLIERGSMRNMLA